MVDHHRPARQPPVGGHQPFAPQRGAGLQATGVSAGIFIEGGQT